MALEDLQAIAGLHVPHSAGSVAAPVVGILTVGSGCHGSAQRRLGDAQRRLGCRRERLLAVMILLPCGLNDTFEISPSWPMRILACAGHRVVDSRGPVCRSRNQPRPSRVESDVQDLIIVPAQGANALPRLRSKFCRCDQLSRKCTALPRSRTVSTKSRPGGPRECAGNAPSLYPRLWWCDRTSR